MTTLFAAFASGQRAPEDMATKALRYLLQVSPAGPQLRLQLNKLLAAAAPGLAPVETFDTFIAQDGGGIPDVEGRSLDGSLIVYIENKFWAGLTRHQPKQYLSRLPDDKSSLLLFVVPESRRGLMRTTLDESLLEQGQVSDKQWREQPVYGLHTLPITGAKVLAVTSWQSLLHTLREAAALDTRDAVREAALCDIAQLSGLCDQVCREQAFLPFSAEEISDQNTPRRATMLASLVRAIIREAEQRDILDPTSREGSANYAYDTYVGSDVIMANEKFWFGLWHEPWQRFGISPLWLAKGLKESTSPSTRERVRRQVFEGFDNWMIPVFMRPDREKEAVVEDAVNQLSAIRHCLLDAPSSSLPHQQGC